MRADAFHRYALRAPRIIAFRASESIGSFNGSRSRPTILLAPSSETGAGDGQTPHVPSCFTKVARWHCLSHRVQVDSITFDLPVYLAFILAGG